MASKGGTMHPGLVWAFGIGAGVLVIGLSFLKMPAWVAYALAGLIFAGGGFASGFLTKAGMVPMIVAIVIGAILPFVVLYIRMTSASGVVGVASQMASMGIMGFLKAYVALLVAPLGGGIAGVIAGRKMQTGELKMAKPSA